MVANLEKEKEELLYDQMLAMSWPDAGHVLTGHWQLSPVNYNEEALTSQECREMTGHWISLTVEYGHFF